MEQRIDQERDRIQAALLDLDTTPQRYDNLYVAQQALAWAKNPQVAKSPYAPVSTILTPKVLASFSPGFALKPWGKDACGFVATLKALRQILPGLPNHNPGLKLADASA